MLHTIFIDIDTLNGNDIGTQSASIVAFDSTGNSSFSSAQLSVADTTALLILDCPSTQFVASSSNRDSELLDYTLGITFLDSCSIQSITQPPSATDKNGLDLHTDHAPIMYAERDDCLARSLVLTNSSWALNYSKNNRTNCTVKAHFLLDKTKKVR